jgi:hypothetical protein
MRRKILQEISWKKPCTFRGINKGKVDKSWTIDSNCQLLKSRLRWRIWYCGLQARDTLLFNLLLASKDLSILTLIFSFFAFLPYIAYVRFDTADIDRYTFFLFSLSGFSRFSSCLNMLSLSSVARIFHLCTHAQISSIINKTSSSVHTLSRDLITYKSGEIKKYTTRTNTDISFLSIPLYSLTFCG